MKLEVFVNICLFVGESFKVIKLIYGVVKGIIF